ncbi:MAG: ABC transporter ATP-binding protein [Lachnospiraceae bacterium]|nr:ABC transporter ATP-binding protein [Lachnospiraceae bacterium]
MKITLDHVTKRFPNRNKKIHEDVIAVSDFTFEIPDGKLIGLLGPSGCGKSTTLNLISGLEIPTSGRIYFGDTDVTDLPAENRGVGLVFQNYALYPHLTVLDNITFPLGNLRGDQKLTKEQMREKAMEVAKLVQISELMERRPSELSGGQQQRVAIARALVKMPSVLLLDEPLSNLDARLRLQTREELARIQKETGITTIFVTHDQEEAMSISDLIVVMKAGVIHQIGKPQEVYDKPCNLFVAKFLGTPPINVFEGCVKGGKLYIGDEAVLDVKLAENDTPDDKDTADKKQKGSGREVWVGIRPEGFIPDTDGPLSCSLQKIEVMGRDTSVVSTHPAFVGTTIRSIIPSEDTVGIGGETVRFRLKPAKVCIFDRETEETIEFSLP